MSRHVPVSHPNTGDKRAVELEASERDADHYARAGEKLVLMADMFRACFGLEQCSPWISAAEDVSAQMASYPK